MCRRLQTSTSVWRRDTTARSSPSAGTRSAASSARAMPASTETAGTVCVSTAAAVTGTRTVDLLGSSKGIYTVMFN